MKIHIQHSKYLDWRRLNESEQAAMWAEAARYQEWKAQIPADDGSGKREEWLKDSPFQRDPSAPQTLYKLKPDNEEKWMKLVAIDKPTSTDIHAPEQQIEALMNEHNPNLDKREKALAWLLKFKVLPNHTLPEWITSLSIHKEPEAEAFVKNYLGVTP